MIDRVCDDVGVSETTYPATLTLNDIYHCDVFATVGPVSDSDWGATVEPASANAAFDLEVGLEASTGPWQFTIAGVTVPVDVQRDGDGSYRLTGPSAESTR